MYQQYNLIILFKYDLSMKFTQLFYFKYRYKHLNNIQIWRKLVFYEFIFNKKYNLTCNMNQSKADRAIQKECWSLAYEAQINNTS